MTFASLPRRWRAVLLCSLGLNLLAAGLALPEADRVALAEAVEARGRGGAHSRPVARRARCDALLVELRHDSFDRRRRGWRWPPIANWARGAWPRARRLW